MWRTASALKKHLSGSNMWLIKYAVLVPVIALSCFGTQRVVAARVPQDEVDALQQMVTTMGATNWTFNADTCKVEGIGLTVPPPANAEKNITCECQNNTCHVATIVLKRLNLPGKLPPELVKLPYLWQIDFAYNCLTGSIPLEWASIKLTSISLLVNQLSGSIPEGLGNFTSLKYLNLEVNQFSGEVPRELGKLMNLKTLILSSNKLSGNLPKELADLKNLTDFRINDNNFNGTIPDFIQNWKQLTRLQMHASGLEGPIPSSISLLTNLYDLRISDIHGINMTFPDLSNMANMNILVLRNCNISGEIPTYIWTMNNLEILDLSFNKFSGELPNLIVARTLLFIFLSGNLLSGNIPDQFLKKGANIDLSYNNLAWQGPEQLACRRNSDLNINLYRSSTMENGLGGVLQCKEDFKCPRYWHSLYINCGGEDLKNNTSNGEKTYQGDSEVEGVAAKFFESNDNSNWGFSSTGDFMDDYDFLNTRHIYSLSSSNLPQLYTTARLSPLSLTYYRYCLLNGNYTVSLHFAEIQFTNDKTFNNLGKRIFDIYIQDILVEDDFNIEDRTLAALTPLTLRYNASVTNTIIEIRFYWNGKGTTRIPAWGSYGPLISAISVDPQFKPPSDGKKSIVPIIVGVVVGSSFVIIAFGIIWWRRSVRLKLTSSGKKDDLKKLDLQTGTFTLKQIKIATQNFDPENKIGEGGFGPVYKGQLSDGTVIAVKQLSSKSSQGNREFLNEIGMISCLSHPNLVKLYGCCMEGDQLLLIYEYLENNSLTRALLGPEKHKLKLDWPTRYKICVGIARGLAFLHQESRLKIVHRDIKGTNILLDKDLNPKISDFGLAKLDEGGKTHISTRIAGTIGYMAPEYALWGYLTHKADVYSFGIVALEIVSGKHNASYGPNNNFACLLDWACHLQPSGNYLELVDESLGSEFNKKEAERMIKVALLCTNGSPSLRPTMSEAVSMLEGTAIIPEIIPEARTYGDDLRFKAIRDHHKEMRRESTEGSQVQFSTSIQSWEGGSSGTARTANDLYDIDTESFPRFEAMGDSEIQMGHHNSEVRLPRVSSSSVPSGMVSSAQDRNGIHKNSSM